MNRLLVSIIVPLLAWLAFSAACLADEPSVPQPEPTNAAEQRLRPVEVEGHALGQVQLGRPRSSEQAKSRALEAAKLEAYYLLACHAVGKEPYDSTAYFGVRSNPPSLVGWLAQAKAVDSQYGKDKASVRLKAPSWHSYESEPPAPQVLYTSDLDEDKKGEAIALCPDGSVALVRDKQLIAVSSSLASFEAVAGPNNSARVLRVWPTQVKHVRQAGSGLVEVTVAVERSESVFGVFVGTKTVDVKTKLEIPVSGGPSIVVTEPVGSFSHELKDVGFKARLEAPSGVHEAALELNGELLWHTPVNLDTTCLDLDIEIDLKPGSNYAKLLLTDKNGRRLDKEWTIIGGPLRSNATRRAVIIGVEATGVADTVQAAKLDASLVRQVLIDRGYTVKTLLGSDATAAQISAAFDYLVGQCGPKDRVVVYYAGPLVRQADSGKLALACSDAQEKDNQYSQVIAGDQLEKWLSRLPLVSSTIIVDGFLPGQEPGSSEVWASVDGFMQSLANPGRNVYVGVSRSSASRIGKENGRLTGCILQAGKACKDILHAPKIGYTQACAELVTIPEGGINPGMMPLMREF